MSAVTVLLADDDEEQLRYLQQLLATLRPEWKVVAAVKDIARLPGLIADHGPSLCILDVGFDGTTGIEVIRSVSSPPPVIYVTGDPSYAIQAFDSAAVDFIVKPVRRDRFDQALARAERHMLRPLADDAVPTAPRQPPTMVRMLRGNDLVIVPLDEVRYFQADRKYTRVVLQNQEGMLRMSLYAIEPYVNPEHFWRIHRGYIINATRVSLAKRDDLGRLYVRVQDRPESLPVARPYEGLFRDGFS